ncbi:BNR/Asp-box repeat protein [Hortaea werneckii]|nr:BNR/Asp-box repeat protein [Hortaea werneckii]
MFGNIAALSLLSVPLAAAGKPQQPPLLTNVTVFDPPDNYTVPRTLYARAMALDCSDTLLATWENYLPTANPEEPCPNNCPENPYIPIYQSFDQGETWSERAKVYDRVNGWGLRYQPFLYEMTEDIGDFAAGTLLLAANSIPADLSETKIDVYASEDEGFTWSFVSSVARGGEALPENDLEPVWEPFMLIYEGELVLYYSDQRDPDNTLGQKMVHQTTTDLLNWGPIVDDVHYDNATFRPGMPIISELPTGDWILTYEFFGAEEGGFHVYYRISDSPLTFDAQPGIPILPADGSSPEGSPYNVWSPAGGENGTIVVSDGNNTPLYLNRALGAEDAWTTLEVPAGASYTRSLLVLPNNPSRIMIVAGGVLGGEDNSVLVTTIDLEEENGKGNKYGHRQHGKACWGKGKGRGRGKGRGHGW